MERLNLTGIIYLASSALLAICNFLPIVTMTMGTGASADVISARMIPTFDGFIGLVAGGVCFMIPFWGMKDKCALIATIAGITSGIFLFHRIATIKAAEAATVGMTALLNQISGSTEATVSFDYSFGFYLYILAIILVVGSSFFYAFSED